MQYTDPRKIQVSLSAPSSSSCPQWSVTPGVLKPPQTAVGIYCHLQAPLCTASPNLRGLRSAFRCSEETPLCNSGLSTDSLSSLKTAVKAGETVRCVKACATKTDHLSLIPGLTRWKEKNQMPLAVFCSPLVCCGQLPSHPIYAST